MALEKTGTPGVYRKHREDCSGKKRCDCPYQIRYKVKGRQHAETYRTLVEAREGKRRSGSGEFSAPSKVTLRTYAREWIERDLKVLGIRPQTRDEYRGHLDKYALRYFPPATKLTELGTAEIQGFIDWLCRQPNGKPGSTLSHQSIRNAYTPLTGCLAAAAREGLIRSNPCTGAKLPRRLSQRKRARVFPGPNGDVMELVVGLVKPTYRLLFEVLAETGLRRSEVLGLRGRDLLLDGEAPKLAVRQRVRRQKGEGIQDGNPKSAAGERDVPISWHLADKLRALKTAPTAYVFATRSGKPLSGDNLQSRVLRPALEEAGLPSGEGWGFHEFRHTVASRLFEQGRNIVQVSNWLGHSSATETLGTYAHLLNDDLGGPLGSTLRSTASADPTRNESPSDTPDLAVVAGNTD